MAELPEGISLDTRLVVNPTMVLREEDDACAILFDPDSGRVRILNTTATAVWKLIDGKRTLSEAIELLEDQFEGMDAEAEDQVLALVGELIRMGALGTITELSAWSR